jgi:hypothetical protein
MTRIRSSWPHTLLAEKHKTLSTIRGKIFCFNIDGWSGEEIQARFAEQHMSKAYHLHKGEEGKLVPTYTAVLIFESPVMPGWAVVFYRQF